MTTPVCDFVREYVQSTRGRFHMPGHKGTGPLGFEQYDITEISGADSLFEASGILRESEANASELFGCPTFYSAEGSSLAIRAMLYLACKGEARPLILAARNAHRAFMYASALIGFEISWLYTQNGGYLSCAPSPAEVEAAIQRVSPRAVYLTSPDYLGNLCDIRGIAEVCHKYGVLLLVDGAHGAYLRFLENSLHPMDLGADMCAASAHKTLPVLTGGAYLHVNKTFAPCVKQALELFGSTSPSYLILESLDACNPYLETLRARYTAFLPRVQSLKAELAEHGYAFTGAEDTKLTFDAGSYGYTGRELARALEARGLFTEFSDPDYMVLMLGPQNTDAELERLKAALRGIPRREARVARPPEPCALTQVMSPRQALMASSEEIPVTQACGRVLASACASCPPAVPVAVCGEELDAGAIKAFQYYGTDMVTVVK